MGKPDQEDDHIAIQVGEWGRRYGVVYIPREIWDGLSPNSSEFVFYLPEHGRFRLEFDVPIRRLNDLLRAQGTAC